MTVLPPLAISLITLYPVRRFASRIGLLARPGGHSTHKNTVPLGGGIGIYVGVLLTFLLGTAAVVMLDAGWWDGSEFIQRSIPESMMASLPGVRSRLWPLWGLLAGGTVLFVLGLADDRYQLPPLMRLGIEFLVAIGVVWGLGFELTVFIQNPWLTRSLSVVWIVGVINSFNMLDNMDGLSGGVAAIIAGAMATVMLCTPDKQSGQPQVLVAALLLVVLGAIAGFLWHNRPPAKIFMGDGGSYFIGYLIAVAMLMATFAGGGGNRPHAVLAPLCAMAVPLYDMTTVLWIRIREGRSIFQGDKSHFSHRLVDLGLSRTQAVCTIYLVTATCGLAAVLLTGVSVPQAAMVLGIVGCMLLLVIILESTSWRNERND